jgi:hypothetical protein
VKKKYDFSKGERVKFYRAGPSLNLPVYLEPDARKHFPIPDWANKALRSLLPLWESKSLENLQSILDFKFSTEVLNCRDLRFDVQFERR